jgi:carbon monoxide dehydrogenase subunit G
MLVPILLSVAAILILFAVVAATRPAAYRVERKLEVAAPADRVFAVLNDLHRFGRVFFLFGSPLEADPKLQKTIDGPAAGVGQSYAWSGTAAGTGKMTIEQSVPGQKVGVKVEFIKPMASKAACAITLTATPAGSLVTWSTEGNHNFVGRAFGLLVDMDEMLGADIEKGLAELKSVAERSATV